MDRSWIQGKQFTPAYIDGVREFMQFVKKRFDETAKIRCPCRRCLNHITRPQSDVQDHIHIYGMSSTYTKWVHHGESFNVEVVEEPIMHGEENVGHMENCDHDGFGISEDDNDDNGGMPELLEELYTSWDQSGEHPKFGRVLEDAKRGLCPESKLSRFSFLVKLLHVKSYYRITNAAFDALAKLLSQAFPNCDLPTSYYDVKQYFRELGLEYECIHVCTNNCVLFQKEYANLDECPICNESRWRGADGNKKVPRKVLRHFPLIPRLKRYFASTKTADDMQWHKLKRQPIENEMRHPADGEAWKEFDKTYPTFAKMQET